MITFSGSGVGVYAFAGKFAWVIGMGCLHSAGVLIAAIQISVSRVVSTFEHKRKAGRCLLD